MNKLMDYSDVDYLFREHLRRQEAIWESTRKSLYDYYIRQGYWPMFADEKAHRDVIELRSQPRNPSNMMIPPEQTTQGDLD